MMERLRGCKKERGSEGKWRGGYGEKEGERLREGRTDGRAEKKIKGLTE